VSKIEKRAKYRGSSGRTPRYPGTGIPILANAEGAVRESAAAQTVSVVDFSTHEAEERMNAKRRSFQRTKKKMSYKAAERTILSLKSGARRSNQAGKN